MFALSFISTVLVGALAVSASPFHARSCDLAAFKPQVPAGMTVPTSAPLYLALGVGVQNYTCNSTTSTYTSTGAVADLFDLSCAYSSPSFNSITNQSYTTWSHSTSTSQVGKTPLLGHHYFVHPTAGAPIAPEWDFTSTGANKGNTTAYVIGAKDVSVAGARPTIDVPSLQLHGTAGQLAKTIFRLETVNGQAPASCTGSGSISIKYTALYVLY